MRLGGVIVIITIRKKGSGVFKVGARRQLGFPKINTVVGKETYERGDTRVRSGKKGWGVR